MDCHGSKVQGQCLGKAPSSSLHQVEPGSLQLSRWLSSFSSPALLPRTYAEHNSQTRFCARQLGRHGCSRHDPSLTRSVRVRLPQPCCFGETFPLRRYSLSSTKNGELKQRLRIFGKFLCFPPAGADSLSLVTSHSQVICQESCLRIYSQLFCF